MIIRLFHLKNKILVFLILLIFASCNKESKPTTLKISIRDQVGMEVSEVSVEILKTELSGNTFSNTFNTISETTTNNSGTVEQEVDVSNVIEFKIISQKDGYFSVEKLINPDNLAKGSENQINIDLQGYCHIQYNFKNIYPVNSSDKVLATFAQPNYSYCDNFFAVPIIGTQSDTSIFIQTAGNETTELQFSITKNNITVDSVRNTFCPVSDTVEININY